MIRLDQLSLRNQGVAMIAAGSVLLLHAFNIMRQGLNIFVVVGALYMIWYGLEISGLLKKIQNITKK